MKVYYVSDSLSWVQGGRLSLFQKSMPQFQFVPVTFAELFRPWNWFRVPSMNCYFTSWRELQKRPAWAARLSPSRCIVSITSHYSLGGALDNQYAIPKGRTEAEALSDATRLLSRFPHVTVNSKILHRYLAKSLPVTLLENGVDATIFTPAKTRAFNAGSIRIGWTGKVKAAKNYEGVIAPTFESLAKEGFKPNSIVVNRDAGEDISRTPQQMAAYYHDLDVYVSASWHEGTPNPALEALACGVPVVTTRVGNMPDLIQDGKNGAFIEPTQQSLRETLLALRRLSTDAYESMSRAARESIMNGWTWDSKIKPFQALFQKVYAHA